MATGFSPFALAGSRYESWAALPQVVTTVALERLLSPQGPTGGRVLPPGAAAEPREIAFVLCVGSREEEGNRYCSRICCPTALNQALELKALLPQARIRIYYRDMRTIKKDWEALYTRAREAGIGFMRGRVRDIRPGEAGGVVIEADQELGQWVSRDRVDLAVLAVGMTPGDGAALREVLKLPVGPDGFFLEAHPKLRPLETVLDGIFLAGACQGPKDLAESITQGSGAAAKILALMAHDTITLDGLICEVDPDKCIGCESCYQECPFQAVEMVGEGKTARPGSSKRPAKDAGSAPGPAPAGPSSPGALPTR